MSLHSKIVVVVVVVVVIVVVTHTDSYLTNASMVMFHSLFFTLRKHMCVCSSNVHICFYST